jgi:hypothetical protein
MSEPEVEAPRSGRLSRPGVVTAIAVLLALAAFAAFLVGEADNANQVTWHRLAWLFTSIEAIAFAAAGALFGATVHRERAEKAEAEARKHAGHAARGKALAAAIKADEEDEGGATRGLDDAGDAGVRRRHARLARELFPDE